MKEFLKFMRDISYLIAGILQFVVTKKNSDYSYQALIRLFCSTGGKSNDIASAIISRINPKLPIKLAQGILGKLDQPDLLAIDSALKENGYYVFPIRLSEEICDKLMQFSLNTKANIRLADAQISENALTTKRDFFERKNPKGTRYDYAMKDLVEDATVQSLFTDPSIIAVANEYLNTKPILDLIAMWWHTSFSKQPDANAAQFFHFDMDRIKWLKFFFYITDCAEENGPHCFISKSHQTGKIPASLLKKGYARNTDEEIASVYPKEDFVQFTAPRGTIIAEDTRGLHKGKHVLQGDRLMFQLEYTSSMFGAELPTYSKLRISEIMEQKTAAQLAKYPYVFSNFLSS